MKLNISKGANVNYLAKIAHAWKLKTFAFINREQKELDKGIENVEDNS